MSNKITWVKPNVWQSCDLCSANLVLSSLFVHNTTTDEYFQICTPCRAELNTVAEEGDSNV